MNKWVEAMALVKANDQDVIDFLYAEIFTHFGVPREIVTNEGPQFVSQKMVALFQQLCIRHRVSSPYHPQANGQVQSMNKVIE